MVLMVPADAKANPTTPILFFSGAAFEADKQRGLDAGASAYVCKPDVTGLLGTTVTSFPIPKALLLRPQPHVRRDRCTKSFR